jgi:hypothetical protein
MKDIKIPSIDEAIRESQEEQNRGLKLEHDMQNDIFMAGSNIQRIKDIINLKNQSKQGAKDLQSLIDTQDEYNTIENIFDPMKNYLQEIFDDIANILNDIDTIIKTENENNTDHAQDMQGSGGDRYAGDEDDDS